MVALDVPDRNEEIQVVLPECVERIDETPTPAASETRKFYFKTLAPSPGAVIQFRCADRVLSTDPMIIWSFSELREFRELKGIQLPRRWPLGEVLPGLKEGQYVTSEAIQRHLREKGTAKEIWLKTSDDEIWALQPDSTIPRWHWVNITEGCPVHGTQIYEFKPYYPWLNEDGMSLRDYQAPIPYSWKIRCPVGGELYPSNDFAAGDMTGGDYPDDGIGGGCVLEKGCYGFIAERCQAYCHQMLRVAPECADSFLVSGDLRYVHKALVALSRLAVEYAYLATMTQHRHRNSQHQVERFGQALFSEGPCLERSGFTVYCIDQPGYQRRIAEAYDKIWPHIEEAQDILAFVQSKGLELQTHEDLRHFLEENLFAVWMQGSMDGATASNEPYAQWGLCRMAQVLNYERGHEFLDWLFDGQGRMRTFLPNGYFRDGAPYESTGGYNGMHVTALGPIVEAVEHLREMRPQVYPEKLYPNLSKSRRYHNVFDFAMNTVNIDRTYPRVGDVGSHPRYEKKDRITWQNGGPRAFEHAYEVFQDPKFAWALAHDPTWKPSLEFPYTEEEIARVATLWPDDWNDSSCLQDGYGLAMLRSGKGSNKRALWMMYGRARGHTHDDIMHLGLDAMESEILGHMGYPRNWNYWEHCWITQIVARQIPFVQMTATCPLFLDAGPIHVAEAEAFAFYDRVGEGLGYQVDREKGQRRTLALVDVDEERFYCLDFYRIWGGEEAWWSFHCQEDEGLIVEGMEFVKQEGGTLAGPDVSYGDEDWLQRNGCRKHEVYGWQGPMFGLAHLYNVNRGKQDQAWSCEWSLKEADGLRFKLTLIACPGTEAFLCDGKSPSGGSPYEMKWLLLHKKDVSSEPMMVCTLMELYREKPVIHSVERLVLEGDKKSAWDRIGLVVQTEAGKDTLLVSGDPSVSWRGENDLSFRGKVAFLREKEGGASERILVQGERFELEGRGYRKVEPRYVGKIISLDRSEESIVVRPRPANMEDWVGRVIQIGDEDRRVAYKVLSVKREKTGARLRLEGDSMIGMGLVTGTDSPKILTSTAFPLRGYRYYHAARITNQGERIEARLAGISSERFALLQEESARRLGEDLLADSFPVGSCFYVYDYGVGDRVTLPQTMKTVSANLGVLDALEKKDTP